jgi:hypothetical protein
MARWPLPLVTLALALSGGCGGEAHEEAPLLATAAAIAKAPPGATGADVGRPAAPTPPSFQDPTPIKKGGPATPPKPPTPLEPVPVPGSAGAPPKGTDL